MFCIFMLCCCISLVLSIHSSMSVPIMFMIDTKPHSDIFATTALGIEVQYRCDTFWKCELSHHGE